MMTMSIIRTVRTVLSTESLECASSWGLTVRGTLLKLGKAFLMLANTHEDCMPSNPQYFSKQRSSGLKNRFIYSRYQLD